MSSTGALELSATEVAVPLKPFEVSELTNCEAVMNRALHSWLQFNRALLTIAEKRYYRHFGYRTFEAYVRERWGIQAIRTAHRMMQSARVMDEFADAVCAPNSQEIANALLPLPVGMRAQFFEQWVEANPGVKPTQRNIIAAVSAFVAHDSKPDGVMIASLHGDPAPALPVPPPNMTPLPAAEPRRAIEGSAPRSSAHPDEEDEDEQEIDPENQVFFVPALAQKILGLPDTPPQESASVVVRQLPAAPQQLVFNITFNWATIKVHLAEQSDTEFRIEEWARDGEILTFQAYIDGIPRDIVYSFAQAEQQCKDYLAEQAQREGKRG